MADEKNSGVQYQGKALEKLTREELVSLVLGQDFVLQRLVERDRTAALSGAAHRRKALEDGLRRRGLR